MNILIFEQYSYSYAPDLQAALKDINLEIKKDECTVILGPSGAGKTTFCLAAAGLLTSYPASVSSGTVKKPVPTIRTALVMQNFYSQITYLRNTVFEEVAFPLENMGLPRPEIFKRVNDVLSQMKIQHLAMRNPLELSGGEKQKIVIATALAQKPDVLILDEPLSQLDPESTSYLSDILHQLKGSITIIIAENDPYLILKIADKIAALSNGEIVSYGDVSTVFNSVGGKLVELPAWSICAREYETAEDGLSSSSPEYILGYKAALKKLGGQK